MAADDINAQFQQHLGRAATAPELDYLNKFIGEGSLQPYEIGQILQGTPEFQKAQLERNTQALGQQFDQGSQGVLDRAAATANSQFASLGRPVTSAQSASVLQAGGQLAQQRQSLLSGFYGQGLNQNMNLYQNGAQNGLERGYGLRDQASQHAYDQGMFNRGNDLYQSYLNQANGQQRNRGYGQLGGALLGGAAGAYMPGGGAMTGMLGARLGAGAGGGLF